MADSDTQTNDTGQTQTPPQQTQQPATQTVDLGTKIKLPDGRELTAAEIASQQAEYEQLKQRAEGLNTLRTQFHTLMNQQAPDHQRQEALRGVLQDAGWSDDQINEYISQQSAGGGSEDDEVDDTTQSDTQPRTDPALEAARQENRQIFRAMLNKEIDEQVSTALAPDKPIGKMLHEATERLQRLDPERVGDLADRIKGADGLIRERLKKAFVSKLSQKLQANGGSGIDISWVSEVSKDAAESVLEDLNLGAAIGGVVNPVGTAPDTVTESIEAFLKTEPKKIPSFDPSKPVGDQTKQAEDAVTDMLTRLAAETGMRGGAV